MEFEEQRRGHAVVGLAVLVDRGNRVLADDLRACYGDAGLDHLDHGLGAAVDRIERTHCGRHGLLHGVELDGDLGDDAEGALGADEEAGQVVARCRFLRPAGGADDAAVGEHHGQGEYVLAHRPVAHCVRARSSRGRHAAQRRVGTRVDREEEAGVADVLVQRLAGHAGLDDRVEVFFVHCEHLVHLRQVDADAALDRKGVAFERSAHAVRDHRHAVPAADVHDIAYFLRGVREDHRIRRGDREVGLVLAVVLADAHGCGQPVAQQRLQFRDHALVEFTGLVHDCLLFGVERRAARVPTRCSGYELF